MIAFRNLSLRRGERTLLRNVDATLHAGWRVGVVGRNGCGKSSLFALIRNELHADRGEVTLPPRWILSHVAQETPALAQPALEFVLDGDVELRELRQIHSHGVAEPQPAILDQHHGGDRGERLRHGVEAEDRVLRHRRASLGIELTE